MKGLFPQIGDGAMAAGPTRFPVVRCLCPHMYVKKNLCRLLHCFYLMPVGAIGNVDQPAVVILPVVSRAGDILSVPLKIGCTDQTGVSICLLWIVTIGNPPLLLRIHLPERLGQPPVYSTEMVLPDDHRQVSQSQYPIHHALAGGKGVTVETKHIEGPATDQQHFIRNLIQISKPVTQVQVVGSIPLLCPVYCLDKSLKGFPDKLP